MDPRPPSKQAAADADQYFTRPEIARECLKALEGLLGSLVTAATFWVEPSAGHGSFLSPLLEAGRRAWGGDIHPQHPRVAHHNYLTDPLPPPPAGADRTVVVGNPPFGRKAKLAGAFINQALRHGGLVAFVVPLQLRKWSAQRHLLAGARLLMDITLDEEAFLFLGKPYKLRCCFQVWTTWDETTLPGPNLRLTHAPRANHDDFEAWQHNCTPESLKYFDYAWDFAVLRQGYGDFSVLYPPSARDTLDRRKQWIFIKARNAQVLERLKRMDFTALSHRNTGTPGFGKADLAHAYDETFRRDQN